MSFVSASLIALIILAFASFFFLFSASAALVFARFVEFARPVWAAAIASASAGILVAAWAWSADLDMPAVLGFVQAGLTLLAWGILRATRLRLWLVRLLGVVLVGAALTFVAGIFGLETSFGRDAMGVVVTLLVAIFAAALPLFVIGMIEHVRRRRVEWLLAFRYLNAGRQHPSLFTATGISAGAIVLGVALLTVVISVVNGFADVMEERIIGMFGHIAILDPAPDEAGLPNSFTDRAQGVPDVVGVTPFLLMDAIARGANGKIQPMQLEGIELATVDGVLRLRDNIRKGSLDELASGERPGIVIGAEAARLLEVEVGDPLSLILPEPGAGLMTAPRLAPFRVVAISDYGMFELNRNMAYASIDTVRGMSRTAPPVAGLRIRSTNAGRSLQTAQRLAVELQDRPDLLIRDWSSSYPGLFESLRQQRVLLFMILSFVLVVSSFTIVATLLVTIMDKESDIAVLKALGCTDGGISRIFALQGLLIGLAGLGAGLSIGLVLAANLPIIQELFERILGVDVLPPEVYQVSTIVWATSPLQLATIAALTLVLAVGATLAPSRQASAVDPAAALRGG